MKKTTALFLVILILFTLTACSKRPQTDTSSDNAITEMPTIEPTAAPTLKYTFDEIVVTKPSKYIDGGNEFGIISEKENYYGEITVGNRSYIEGTSDSIDGTYALFVTDEGGQSTGFNIEIKKDGYVNQYARFGNAVSNEVAYPFDENENNYPLTSYCYHDTQNFVPFSKLCYVEVFWGDSQLIQNSFRILTVTISKDEAIRYAQDGTLPYCLQGLNVTGLDKIFKKPNSDATSQENISEPGATVSVTEILPPNYSYISVLSSDLLAVKFEAGDKYGIINKSGDVIAQQIYDIIRPFSDGMAVVRTDPSSGEGYIDESGNMIVPFGRYHENRSFSESLAAVKSDVGWGFIDPTGKEAIPCQYEQVGNFADGMAPVKLNGKWIFIDKTGKVLYQLSLKHDDYNVSYLDFHDGMANVVLGSGDSFLGGYIDTEGNEVIPCTHEGWSFEADNGKWGIFSDGVTTIEDNTGYFVIDKSGKEVVAIGKYSYIAPFFEGRAVVTKTDSGSGIDQFSIIDTKGNEIVTLGKYEQIKDFSDGVAAIYSNGKNGLIDTNGNEILPLTDNYQGTNSPVYGMVPFSKDTHKYGLYEIKLK